MQTITFLDILLIMNGHGGYNPEVLTPSGVMCTVAPPKHPDTLGQQLAKMVLFNQIPVTCGGMPNNDGKKCFRYNKSANTWDLDYPLMSNAFGIDGGMVVLNNGEFFVTGQVLVQCTASCS